ncbi:MAG: S9 family peptidase [Candidatus Aminicenantes bacterium]|nr:S9 family peptidase [Candidatus Aminicenantes bacterium]
MRKMSLVFILVFFVFAAAETTVPGPSFEKVISLRSVGSPVLSPDGKSIAFSVRTVNWEKNSYDSEIWLVKEGEKPFQLTRTKDGRSGSHKWSPDGKWISFLADRGEKSQIYLIRPDGGEAQMITDVKGGINSYEWFPCGKKILFSKTEEESKSDKEREKRYGRFAVEDAEYRYTHLWVIDVKPDMWPTPAEVPCYPSKKSSEADKKKEEDEKTKSENECLSLPKAVQLTKGSEFTVTGYALSPCGKKVAFSHQADPLRNSYITSDISILDIESGDIKPLVKNPGSDSGPVWSPDGEWILYHSAGGNTTSDFYKNNQIYKIPAEGGEPVRMAAGLDEEAYVMDWNPGGVYLSAWQKTKRQIFRLDTDTGEVWLFADTPWNIWYVDFSEDGKMMAFSGETPTTLDEIYKTPVDPYQPVVVTDFSKQIEGWKIGTSEVIRWKSKDGTEIEGVLHKPDDFDPGKKYPLFIIIHGGPTGIDYPSVPTGYVYPIIQWLEKGALVLRPNYRGSAGYGEKFRSLNVRNLGVGDMWDVMSGVDYLIKKGWVDPNKMGAMGWSQGGYISAFLTTNTGRFQAISVGAGISNWMTYYVNTDIHPFTRQYLKATPWVDPEIYAKTSPMTNITKAGTPTLIQHGEFDRRVPIPNAYELFQGLQDMGVTTKLIVYKGFGHGITKPKERLAATWHNWQWFAKYIWGEEIDIPL